VAREGMNAAESFTKAVMGDLIVTRGSRKDSRIVRGGKKKRWIIRPRGRIQPLFEEKCYWKGRAKERGR